MYNAQLFAAIDSNKLDSHVIKKLVADGANINAVNEYGDSVLMEAIGNVRTGLPVEVIQLLIDLDADVNNSAEGEFNCLYLAAMRLIRQVYFPAMRHSLHRLCGHQNPI